MVKEPAVTLGLHLLPGLPQAARVVAHLQKKAAKPSSEDGPASGPFVWKKKVEKQLQDGASVRELTAAAAVKQQEDRLVRAPPVWPSPGHWAAQGTCSLLPTAAAAANARLALQREIEKVRKRREDREHEKAQMEEEQALLARERAYAENLETAGKEEEVRVAWTNSLCMWCCCLGVD